MGIVISEVRQNPRNPSGLHLGRFAAAIVIASALPVLCAGEKVDINGDFEQSDDGSPAQWGNKHGARITDEVHQSGTNSLALAFPVAPNSGRSQSGKSIDSSNFKPNEMIEISVSAFLKSDLAEGEYVGFGLDIHNPEGARKAGTGCNFVGPAGEWQTVTKTLTIPDGFDESWRVGFFLVAGRKEPLAEEKDAFFDDVSIEVISQ